LFKSVERFGRLRVGFGGVEPRAVFFPTVQAKTGLTGFALWAVEKDLSARKSLLLHGFACSDVERLLRCLRSLGSF
jgi:hypothetical protein